MASNLRVGGHFFGNMDMTKDVRVRQTWKMVLGDIAQGRRGLAVVKEFDKLCNVLLATDIITIDEYIGSQITIGAALRSASMLENIRKE